MALAFTDPEQWAAAYDAASAQQRYRLLLDVLTQSLSPQLVEELDLAMLLVEMQDQLVSQNLLDLAMDLVQVLQRHQPDLYQQEFSALDHLRVQYALYRNDAAQTWRALQQFIACPSEDIDQTLVVLDYLKLYDAMDLAVELCRAAYPLVEASPAVLPGTELKFSGVIVDAQLQAIHEQFQAQQPVNWEAFDAEVALYRFHKPNNVAELARELVAENADPADICSGLKRDRATALHRLALEFCRAMTAKQMSFVCSHALWDTVLGFWESRDLPRKQLAQPSTYFALSAAELERYVAQQINGFLSMQQAVGVALVWGMPYVYEFLVARQIIPVAVQQQALAAAAPLKIAILRLPQLWKYDFVHRWQPPDSVSAAEFAAEAAQFAASLSSVTPLSDSPTEIQHSQLAASGFLAPFGER